MAEWPKTLYRWLENSLETAQYDRRTLEMELATTAMVAGESVPHTGTVWWLWELIRDWYLERGGRVDYYNLSIGDSPSIFYFYADTDVAQAQFILHLKAISDTERPILVMVTYMMEAMFRLPHTIEPARTRGLRNKLRDFFMTPRRPDDFTINNLLSLSHEFRKGEEVFLGNNLPNIFVEAEEFE